MKFDVITTSNTILNPAASSIFSQPDYYQLLKLLSAYVFHPALVILSWLLMLTVVVGNVVIITAIWREKQLHSATNFLVASLAVADLLVGLIVMPFSIITEIMTDQWVFGSVWCDMWHSFDVLGSTASIFNLVTISYDRYLAITNPINYPTKMTHKKVFTIIVFLWSLAASISFPAIVWWRLSASKNHYSDQTKCPFTNDRTYVLLSSTVSFYAPLVIMLYAYYRIYIEAIRQTRFLNFGLKTIRVHKTQSKFVWCCFWRRKTDNSFNTSTSSSSQTKVVLRAHRGGGGGGSSHTSATTGRGVALRNSSNQSSLNFSSAKTSQDNCNFTLENMPPATKPPPSLLPLMIMNSDTSNESADQGLTIKVGDKIKGTSSNNSNNKSTVFEKKRTSSESFSSRPLLNSIRRKYGRSKLNNNKGCLISVTIDDCCYDTKTKKQELKPEQTTTIINDIVNMNSLEYIDSTFLKKTFDVDFSSSSTRHADEDCGKVSIDSSKQKLQTSSCEVPGEKKVSNIVNSSNGEPTFFSAQLATSSRSVGKKLSKLAKERKAAKTLGIVVGVFMLCWLPFFIINIIRAFCTDCIYEPELVMLFVTWLGWVNSALNPFIYACWSREFRRAFRKVITSWYIFLCGKTKNFDLNYRE